MYETLGLLKREEKHEIKFRIYEGEMSFPKAKKFQKLAKGLNVSIKKVPTSFKKLDWIHFYFLIPYNITGNKENEQIMELVEELLAKFDKFLKI